MIRDPEEILRVTFTNSNMLKVTFFRDEIVETKYITFEDFVGTVLSAKDSKYEKVQFKTPVLPQNCVQYIELTSNSYIIVLKREKGNIDMIYSNRVFKQVGIPTLLFAFKLYKNTLNEGYVVAIKDTKFITLDTKLYCYPFSNVYEYSHKICWGSNKLPTFDEVSYTQNIPDMFLSMPNSNHGYGKNLSGLEYRPLLEALEEKEFNEDWLLETNQTYEEWINMIIKN